ncbi:MAG: carboxypeptidase regulatory-like domain-containing protein, partial [Candidatus Cloacimonadaceae bacterium]|nr:carboxypeptidase regulatory-like domain-containing protein [Candidatus Cloacimonadaceae bacterium]
GQQVYISWTAPAQRYLAGYMVYRLSSGNEANEESWLLLTPMPVTATAIVDLSFQGLPYGAFLWAVKAIYEPYQVSPPAFSNTLVIPSLVGFLSGTVRDMQNNPLSNVVLSNGIYQTLSIHNGSYNLPLPAGTHSVTASKPGYMPLTIDNIVIQTYVTTTLNFILGHVNTDEPVPPVRPTGLHAIYPNPFRHQLTIDYATKSPQAVMISVFNAKGQLIKYLMQETKNPGNHLVLWDGKDVHGNLCSSGVYFIRMKAGRETFQKKVLILR